MRVVHGDLAPEPADLGQRAPRVGLDPRRSEDAARDGGRRCPPRPTCPNAPTTWPASGTGWEAIEANNSVWELIEKDGRSTADDEEMLQRAYAARYHWARAAGSGPINVSRGAWLLAEVQLLVGQPQLALRYADESLTPVPGARFRRGRPRIRPRDEGAKAEQAVAVPSPETPTEDQSAGSARASPR